MARKQWVWDKFYGGLADYPAIISSNDSTKYGNESFSVDGRKEPNGIQLGQFFTTSQFNISGDATAFIDLKEFFPGGTSVQESIVTVTKTGNVYQGIVSSTPVHTFTTSAKEIYGMSVLNVLGTNYLYFFSPYGISRADINSSTLALSNFQENYRSFTNNGYSKTVVYNIANKIYFSSGSFLKSLNSLEVVNNTELALPDRFTITGITFYQGTMKVYGKSKNNGTMYAWDPESGSNLPDYVIPYDGLPVLGVDGDSGIDYAIMGYDENYCDCYALSGSSAPQLIISNTEGDISQRKFNGIIKRRLGINYIAGSINGQYCIFSLGKYHNGYPNSLQVEARTGNITAIYPRSTDMLFGNNVGGGTPTRVGMQIIGDRIGYHKYIDIGEVVSMVFTGGKRSLKTIIGVEICFDNDSTNTYYKHGGEVSLYARTKTSTAWQLIRTFDTTTITDGFVNISPNEFGDMLGFNQIELKLRLNSAMVDGSYKISPLITSVTTTYDDNIKSS